MNRKNIHIIIGMTCTGPGVPTAIRIPGFAVGTPGPSYRMTPDMDSMRGEALPIKGNGLLFGFAFIHR